MTLVRCEWANGDPLAMRYHDVEWGAPEHDDCKLFELLVLEGAQAGLSWMTILKKRESYRSAFDGFDPELVARYGQSKVAELLSNPGIIRNRLKIAAAIQNAHTVLSVREAFGSLDAYLWPFVGGVPKKNAWKALADIPDQTNEAVAMSSDLKKRGFKFVGPTICYAFMQATGMVNDHLVYCYRYNQIS